MARFLILLVLIYSCSSDINKAKHVDDIDKTTATHVSDTAKRLQNMSVPKDTSPVFHLLIDSIQKEKVISQSPLGENVNDFSEIIYLFPNDTILKVEWRIETSITIQGEGPHCDLTQWKHGYTPWEMILPDSIPEYEVRIIDHFAYAHDLFPEVDMYEYKKYVRGFCRENWYQHIRHVKSIHENPSNIGFSRLIFRVNFKSKSKNKYFSKVFHVDLAMGC